MTSSQPSGWFSGRTRLITIVSAVALGLAGATVVRANIGIHESASAPVTVADTAAPPASTANVQEFAVDVAGMVAVTSTQSGLRLANVTPTGGWTWTLAQISERELIVTFTDRVRTLEFTATATFDGRIIGDVNEPTVTLAPPAAEGPSGTL